MSRLLQKPWYLKFRAEMEAIGCVFPSAGSMFGDEDIKIPVHRQNEAREIIIKYSVNNNPGRLK